MKKLLFFNFVLLFLVNSIVLSQSTESEEPRLKSFGWSLNKNSKKETEKSNSPIEKNSKAGDEIIRVETNLVINDVLVTDKQGRSITGLTKQDFIVTEDNTRQVIETFALGNDVSVPRSIVLILDYSGSLLPYVKTSIEAAKVLVDTLNPNDRMAIVTDDIELLTEFTRDKKLLKEQLESLKIRVLSGKTGNSQQFSALYAVLNEIIDEEDIRPVILFQTDGDEYLSLKDGRVLTRNQKNFSFDYAQPFIRFFPE